MKIDEFCDRYKISASTIYKNITFGIIKKTGKNEISDESAKAFLEKYQKKVIIKRTGSCVLEVRQWDYIEKMREEKKMDSKSDALRQIIDEYMKNHKH